MRTKVASSRNLESALLFVSLKVAQKVAVEDGAGGGEDEVDARVLLFPRKVRVVEGPETALDIDNTWWLG